MAVKIDFYVFEGTDASPPSAYACRLIEKAVLQGLTVCVRLPSADEVNAFDALLWSFSDHSFVPHAIVSDASEAVACNAHPPVWLSVSTPVKADLLINLCEDAPSGFEGYRQLADFVNAAPARREAGRRRFAHYRDAGYPPNTHRVTA